MLHTWKLVYVDVLDVLLVEKHFAHISPRSTLILLLIYGRNNLWVSSVLSHPINAHTFFLSFFERFGITKTNYPFSSLPFS